MNKDRDNRKEALGELVRFALVGGLATLLHWLIYWGLLPWCNAYVAYSAAYMLSFLFNFLATSYVTFRSRPTWTRLWGMAGAHVVNYLLQTACLSFFLWLGVSKTWAPLPMFAICVPVNFVLVRYFLKK